MLHVTAWNIQFYVFVSQEVDVRFIEYMPFDGNKWNRWKMVPYAEMISHIHSWYPDLIRLKNSPSDTSKVCILLFKKRFSQYYNMSHSVRNIFILNCFLFELVQQLTQDVALSRTGSCRIGPISFLARWSKRCLTRAFTYIGFSYVCIC